MVRSLTGSLNEYQDPNMQAQIQRLLAQKAPSNKVQGLAYLLDQGLAGFMMGRDKKQRRVTDEALMRGYSAKPWVNPNTGMAGSMEPLPEGQMGPPEFSPSPDAGGIKGAIEAISKVDGGPYARGLAKDLMFKQAELDTAANLRKTTRAQRLEDLESERGFQRSQAEILAGGRKDAADLLFKRQGITAGTKKDAEIAKAKQLFLRTPRKGADGFMYYPADPDVPGSKTRRAFPNARNLELEKFKENKKLIEQLTGPDPAPEQSSSLNAIPGGPPLRQLASSTIDLGRYVPFQMDDRNNVTLYQDKTTGDIIPADQMPNVMAPTLAGSTTSTAKKPTLRQLFQSFPYEIQQGILQSGDVKKGISKYLLRQKSGFEIKTNADGSVTVTQGDGIKGGLTKTVKSSTQKNILEGQSRVDAQNYVSSLYRPEFLTYGGEIKSGIMTKLNKLTPTLRDSFTKARAAFLSQTNQAFIAYRKWATGVAGGEKEMSEIKRATFSEDDSPQDFEAKLQAVQFMTRKLLARQQMALRQGVTPENDAQGNPIGKKWKDFVKLNPISDVPTLQKRGVELEGLGYSKDKIKTILRHEYGLTQ